MLKAHLTSPLETESGSAHSLDGEDGLGELAKRMQSRLSSLSRSNSAASVHGSGRNSTSKLASLPGSKLSLASNPQRVDLDTTIKILHEVKKNASPEDLKALHEALQPTPSSPSNAPAPDLKRKISLINRSSLSLIRRRSLITTPGVATRNSPTEGNRRWSSWRRPHLEPEEEAKWNVEMMGRSPLTRIAALDLAEGRDTPTPRAQTPSDLDYSHLGSLKLGSLIVTNGAASPAPSSRLARRNSNPHLSLEDDYFTASEGSASPVTWKMSRKWGHSRSKSTVPSNASTLQRNLSISDEIRRAKTMSRCDSPLKIETHNFHLYDDPEVETFKLRLRVINKSADTLARAYMAEIPSSPFVTPDDPLPEVRRERGSENQTESVESHNKGSAESYPDSVSFREQAFRILDGTIFNDPDTTLELSSPTQAVDPSSRNSSQKSGRPSPRKADSGYSSGGSVRTMHREPTGESTSQPSKQPSVVADMLKTGDDAASLYTFDQMVSLTAPKKPLPPLPKDDSVKARPATLQIPGPATSHASASPTVISPGTPVSVASMFTIDSQASSITKRLQRRRPSQPELPIVQSCQPIPDGTIPSIPVSVRAQFVRRLSESPTMECLTQTYLSKDHIKSSKSEIDAPTAISLVFPTPSASPEPRGRHHTRSRTERPSKERPHSLRRSLSLFRTKSSMENKGDAKREEENTTPTIVDFGTAAQMIGRSPYDAAMSTVHKTPLTSPTHPHQLGNALPRAKSMVHMDSQTAAEFARMRSKDRALGPPEMLQRPKSHHDLKWKAEEANTSRRNRHTIFTNVPAVSTDIVSLVRDASPQVEEASTASAETRPNHNIRARSTGRGVVVSQLVDQFDKHGQKIPQIEQQPDWDSHARLWSQRRKSIGEGLRQQAAGSPAASSTPLPRASHFSGEMVVYDRYSGGLDYGYEPGYGIGGSAGTRQLHSYSYASRKSMHYSNQYGVDLSDVPVFVQRC